MLDGYRFRFPLARVLGAVGAARVLVGGRAATGDEALPRCYAPPRKLERAMPPARLLAALAVCAIALAACGSSSKPSSSGSAGTQALKYANCMRANGMPNFPDPGSNGALPNPASPAFRAAEKACAKLQPVGLHLGGPARADSRRIARRARVRPMHARTRVLAVPGSANDLWAGLYAGPGGILSQHRQPTEIQSPAFRQAAKACGVQLPTGPP